MIGRREAEGIPNLLVAPKISTIDNSRDIYANGVGDFRGRYADGTFYAGPDEVEVVEEEEQDVQALYFHSILIRYEALRQRLSQTPPLEILQKLGEDTPIYLGQLNAPKVRWWRWKMRTVDPFPAQVAAMDKDSVLGLLRLLGSGNLLRRGADVELSVSRWVWSLLAKLPDRGALNSEEIGLVRELGKKAVLVGVGLREGNKWDEGMQEVEATYDMDDEDEGYDGVYGFGGEVEDEKEHDEDFEEGLADVTGLIEVSAVAVESTSAEAALESSPIPAEGDINVDELALAKARMLGLLQPEVEILVADTRSVQADAIDKCVETVEATSASAKKPLVADKSEYFKFNSTATVDMILTIAGEMYGQRDLLEFRGGWSV
jgi:hypothetical protein